MLTQLAAWLTTDAAPSERDAFERERVQHNLKRIRAFVPVMFLVHVGHVIALHVSEAARATMAAPDLAWHDGLVANNAALVPISALITLLAWPDRRPAPIWQRWLGELTFVVYMTHAAVSTVVDQHITASIHAFIIGALAPAVVFRVTSTGAIAAYVSGLATLWIGTGLTQPSDSLRLSAIAGALTVAAVGFALARTMTRGMAREVHDKGVIEDKTRALSAIKESLEVRVAEQVKEIVENAAEVERLDAQLMERVRERSTELSRALAQLATERPLSGDLKAGDEVGGRVVVARLLGQGGMGAVYAGHDRVAGREVAVKIVRATSADELDALQRFLREARAAASISHPAIVRSLHVDVDEAGRFYQILELVEGETLARRVARAGAMPPGDASRIGSVLAEALAAAHAVGVVHRDVKPQNVMLTAEAPGVKLLDFGIAKAPVLRGEAASHTRSGVIVGTPEYIAPEQIQSPADAAAASDVYNVGLVLFWLVSGRLAFEAPGGPAAFLYAHVAVLPPRLDEVAQNVPLALADLVARCLEKRPEDRPSATDLALQLRDVADAARAKSAIEIAADTSASATRATSGEAETKVALRAG